MEDIKNMFMDLRDADQYHRVVSSHPLAWYIGLDNRNRYSLFVIVTTQPKSISSTKLMSVFVGVRRDGNYGITFSLKEQRNLEIFVHFCEDMISFTRCIVNASAAADCICSRYSQWQKAFIKTGGKLLPYEAIKGLIGELCFLKMNMIPLYGAEKAVDSWSGPEGTDQDFACNGTWYEVKSTVSGSSTVKISSVEQLDVKTEGHLVVVSLDKTSDADTSRITLNSMVELVRDSISSAVCRDVFMNRLLAYGYYFDKGYDEYGFKYDGMTTYKVTSDFPCLRKINIPAAVGNVKYELSLAAIEAFVEE